MPAKKLDTETRQEQIARAALDLVAERGLKGLSVAAVARRVGIVPSAIYRHFRSKDGVVDAVLGLIRGRLLANVAAACEETPEPLERLHGLLVRHVALVSENRALPRLVFSQEAAGGSAGRRAKVGRILRDYLAAVATILAAGQRAGRIRADVDAPALAVMFLGIVQPPVILWHLRGGRFDVSKQVAQAWRVFRDALRKE